MSSDNSFKREFSTKEACKLAGVGLRQTQDYTSRDIILPVHPSGKQGGRTYYTSQNIVEIAAAKALRGSGLSRDDLKVFFQELNTPGKVFRNFALKERPLVNFRSLLCDPCPSDKAVIGELMGEDHPSKTERTIVDWFQFWGSVHQLMFIGKANPRKEANCLILPIQMVPFIFSTEAEFVGWLKMETDSIARTGDNQDEDSAISNLRIFDVARI
ncbi:MerR family transcriptional regulator, partial [Gemmatimonadota bacterium]